MKKVATIILNRNLPTETDALAEHIKKYDTNLTDIYVVEAGSDEHKLSKHCSWWANWDDAKENGLRAARGFNYGLLKLWEEKKFDQYDYFFLITNDTVLEATNTIEKLVTEIESIPKLGIISPCSKDWGEKLLLHETQTKFFWYIHNTAYLIKKELVQDVMPQNCELDHFNFLFDGNNFRGFAVDFELIIKGYANDWGAAITSKVWAEENEALLLDKAEDIKTDQFSQNIIEYVKEGNDWLKNKYGFKSYWNMKFYGKYMYDQFFQQYPELNLYKI